MSMTMKSARDRYRRLFSKKVDVSKTEVRQLVRVFDFERPSFKEWARSELKGVDVKSPKLQRIIGRRR
jgi:hypothetical protein